MVWPMSLKPENENMIQYPAQDSPKLKVPVFDSEIRGDVVWGELEMCRLVYRRTWGGKEQSKEKKVKKHQRFDQQ